MLIGGGSDEGLPIKQTAANNNLKRFSKHLKDQAFDPEPRRQVQGVDFSMYNTQNKVVIRSNQQLLTDGDYRFESPVACSSTATPGYKDGVPVWSWSGLVSHVPLGKQQFTT